MKRNKLKFVVMPFAAVAMMAATLAGCASDEAETVNEAPEIDGAHEIECLVNTRVDLLDGVAALDAEDGDITADMKMSIRPSVGIQDGYAVFPEQGTYNLTYTAKDAQGLSATETVIINVTDRELYHDFVSAGGFSCQTGGNAQLEIYGPRDGIYRVKATGAEVAEDVQLVREFDLVSGGVHTFTYHYYSYSAGRVTLTADGYPFAVADIYKGEHYLTFEYVPYSEEATVTSDIAMCIGGAAQDGVVNFMLFSVDFTYPGSMVEEGEQLSDSFAFSTEGDENTATLQGRFDGTEGTAVTEDGSSATLNITSAGDAAWRGGMFINTGVNILTGATYTVSFDLVTANASPVSISVQNNKWNEYKYADRTEENLTGGGRRLSYEFSTDSSHEGVLWLYIQSGNYVNTVTLSDLSVTAIPGGSVTENILLEDFTHSEKNGYTGSLSTADGGFTYILDEVSSKDDDQMVNSPRFKISGSSKNYVVSFVAKASAPVEIIFASPKYGGWDPTWFWQRLTLSQEEQLYTVEFYNDINSFDYYYLTWQFGSAANSGLTDVKIEIKDIKISLKTGEELENN